MIKDSLTLNIVLLVTLLCIGGLVECHKSRLMQKAMDLEQLEPVPEEIFVPLLRKETSMPPIQLEDWLFMGFILTVTFLTVYSSSPNEDSDKPAGDE